MPRTISRPDEPLSFRNASCSSTISQKACHVASRFTCRDSSFEYRCSLTEHRRQVSIVVHPVSVLFDASSSTFRPFRRTDLFGKGRRAVVSRTAVWHPNQPIPIHSANLCDDGQTGNHGLDVLRDSRPSTHRARAPTPYTATLFNVLAKVNLFAQARIETSEKAVPLRYLQSEEPRRNRQYTILRGSFSVDLTDFRTNDRNAKTPTETERR